MLTVTNRPNKEGKVKNFAQVEAILRSLKVKFDAKLINQIMNEERGAALRLLYQMKLCIQKDKPDLFPGFDPKSLQATMTGLEKDIIDRKVQETLLLKQTLPSMNRFTTMNKSKKLEPIEKNLLKFEHTMKKQVDKAYSEQRAEEEFVKKLVQDQRTLSLNKMTENRQFMQDWEVEGKKNWRANQKKMADMTARQKYFEDKEVSTYKNKLMKELDEATKEMMGGLDEFEKNLQKLGIEKNTNIEEAKKKMEEKKGIPPGQIQNFSYAATMNKIKENKNMQDFAAKERDRRRRKMVVDQSKTQQNLDKKKNEAELIEKLMKKQAEEQQFAYLEARNLRCKELIIKNREEKSAQYDVKAQAESEIIEKKRQEAHAAVVDAHKKEIQENKKYFREVRRSEKLEKRSVNIELISEVIDLIMDVADQAYETTSKRKNKKLEKPEWRQWMNIFTDGKLVTSVVGNNQKSLSEAMMGEDEAVKDNSFIDPLVDPSTQIEDLLDEMKFDPAYEDMLSYISGSGMFNLQLEGFNHEWGQIKEINFLEGINMNFQFLDSLIPPTNPELGKTMSEILQNVWKEDKTDVNLQITQKEEGIPNHLTGNFCLLGRKFAGKRTIAKQIQEQYPGKIKIFKMDDIIKEAYDYVNPKPQAIEEKVPVQKKAMAKKTEEPQFVDQFAGQDTTKYKELGNKVRAILGENFDFNNQLTQTLELTDLIADEEILVKLFIQKLKLSYINSNQSQTDPEVIKANLIREKELLAQLEEIEQQNIASANMDAKKKAPPAKAKGAVSNEEQIRTELEQIQKCQMEGWILIDFPRTLTQAKIFEKYMSGYTCVVDQNKSLDQKKFEQWSKLITCSLNQFENQDQGFPTEPKIFKSAIDAFLFLEVDKQETLRRTTGRKIDPQTGTIYHMEDNPPPENDAKLKDRLQIYTDPEADPNKVHYNNATYDQNSSSLIKWISGFGLSDEDFPQIKPVESLLRVEVNDIKKKDQVFIEAMKKLKSITDFKQAQFDAIRAKVKDSILRETQLSQEEVESPIKIQTIQDALDEEVKQAQQINQSAQQEAETAQQLEISAQRSVQSQPRHSQQSLRSKKTTHRSELEFLPLNNKQKKDLWETFEQSYYKDNILVFRNIKRQRELVFDGLVDIQQRFIEFLHREDQKQMKIHDFVESFNKFSDEFPDLREDQQTKDELVNRIDRLNNDLWSIIEQRKDESLLEHQRIITNNWIQHEMRKLIRYGNTIIQSEIKKYNVIYKIIVGQDPSQVIQVENQLNSYVDQGIEPIEKSGKSPLLAKLFSYILKVVQYQNSNLLWLEPATVKMLQIESDNMIFRLNMIHAWITLKLQEFYNFSTQVFEVLDDWVLVGVEEENRSVQSIIKRLKSAVLDNQSRLDYHSFKLEPLDLYQKIQIQNYSSSMSPTYMLNVSIPSDTLAQRFKVNHLEQLYKDIRQYCFEEYLDGQTFIHLIVLALKENRCPNAWRFFDFSVFNNIIRNFKIIPLGHESNQNSVYTQSVDNEKSERDFIDWKRVFLRFILLQTNFQQDSIDNYCEQLQEAANEDQELNMEAFIKVNNRANLLDSSLV